MDDIIEFVVEFVIDTMQFCCGIIGVILMKIVVTDAKTIGTGPAFFEPLKDLGELVIYELTKPEGLCHSR